LRCKPLLFSALFIVSSLILVANVRAADFSWKDDFNYASLQEMQTAGWILENPSGTRLESGGVVIDGTKTDTVIRFRDFPSGITDWSVETKSMWLGVGHSAPGLNVITKKHTYSAHADGWYDVLVFNRDGQDIHVGSYTEQANTWVTISLIKKGDNIKMYFNGELVYTYIEKDLSSSELVGVDRIAPWKGVMLYDYYQVGSADIVPSTGDFPIFYVGVVGGSVAVVVVGAAVYFFFFSGGTTTGAASAAISSAAAASLSGIDADALSTLASDLVTDTVTDVLDSIGYDISGSSDSGNELLLRSDSDPVVETVFDTVSNSLLNIIEQSCIEPKPETGTSLGIGGQSDFNVDVQVGDGQPPPPPPPEN
jgi:hypothetical protein